MLHVSRLLPYYRGIRYSVLNWRITLVKRRSTFMLLGWIALITIINAVIFGAPSGLIPGVAIVIVLCGLLILLPEIERRGTSYLTCPEVGYFRRNHVLLVEGERYRVVYTSGTKVWIKKVR